jgi:hypothetical protein
VQQEAAPSFEIPISGDPACDRLHPIIFGRSQIMPSRPLFTVAYIINLFTPKEVLFRSLFVSFEEFEDPIVEPSRHIVLDTLHALPRAGDRQIVAAPAHTGHSRFHVRWSHGFFQRLISWTRFYALMKKGSSNQGNKKVFGKGVLGPTEPSKRARRVPLLRHAPIPPMHRAHAYIS